MVISTVTGVNSPVQPKEIPKVESSITESQLVKRVSREEIGNIMSTESYIRKYFSDIPIMVQVAKCESRFRQLDSDGDIHRGRVNNLDVGVMQINEHYHLDKSVEENYDIYTIEGNTAYARELYEKYGTQPWSSSKACWGKYDNSKSLKDLAVK
ncbi:MAG TPA: hypothetical protein VJC13_03655 [Candidatus Paceibacterota bacterium]